MGALFVTLIFIAGWVILWILHVTLGKISVFGFHPFNFFYNLATDTLKSTWGEFKRFVPPFARMLWSWVMTIWRPLYVILDLITHLTAQILGVQQNSNQGLAQVRSQEQTDVANANAHADELYAVNHQHTDNLFAQAEADIAAGDTTVLHEAEHLYNLVEGDLANQIAQAKAHADAVGNEVLGQAEHLYNLAEGDIVNSLAEAKTYANQVGNVVLGDAEHLYNLAEGDITNQVAASIPTAVARAVAAVQPQISKIQTAVDDCLEPLCDTVTPQAPRLGRLGNLLQGLESLGVEALLIALAAECLTDPAAVAHDVDAVVTDVGGPIMAGFRDLIGG
jgi:hypothetical protein